MKCDTYVIKEKTTHVQMYKIWDSWLNSNINELESFHWRDIPAQKAENPDTFLDLIICVQYPDSPNAHCPGQMALECYMQF